MNGFDIFAPGAPSLALLLCARISGLVLIAPLYAARPIPMMVRTCLVLLLTLLLIPATPNAAAFANGVTPLAVLGEVLIGFVIGLGAALLVGAAETAGELLSIQIGLQGSAIVDPLAHQQTTALGQFTQLFSLTLLLSVNAHLVLIDALASSVRVLPLGAAVEIREGLWRMLQVSGSLFALGLQFAAPIIAVVLIANVALAVLSRAAPQLNILSLAFPIQILLGLATLIALIPLLGSAFRGWEPTFDSNISRMLPQLLGGR